MSLADQRRPLSSIINQLCSDWAQLMQTTGPGNKHYSGEKGLYPHQWLASDDIIKKLSPNMVGPYWSEGFPLLGHTACWLVSNDIIFKTCLSSIADLISEVRIICTYNRSRHCRWTAEWYSVTINIVIPLGFRSTQQPRCVDPMPIQYWSDVADAGPALNRIGCAEQV